MRRRTKREERERLRSVPLFRGLSKRELETVRQAAKEVEFGGGTDIVEEGMKAKDFFVILDGEAKVSVNGRRKATLGPGDYFGEMSVLDGGPRTATVTALTPVVALRVDSANLLSVLSANASITKKIMLELAGRLRETERSVSL